MGAGIFSDDTAADILAEYREMLKGQVPDDEATRRVVDEYKYLDADEEHVMGLALAAAQSQVGRLNAQVKAEALDVIDSGRGLEPWEEAGPRELAQRKAALSKLRDRLTGPQPARKTMRQPWRYETDLRPGDILSFTASNGQMALLRVLRVDHHKAYTAVVVEWLDWTGRSLPADPQTGRLKARLSNIIPVPGSPRRPATYRIAPEPKTEPDWQDSGFILATHLPPRPGLLHVLVTRLG